MSLNLLSKQHLKDWLFYVITWTILTLFYSYIFLSFMKLMLYMMELDKRVSSDQIMAYFISNYQYLESVTFGLLFGTATFFINALVDKSSIHKLSFGNIILVKTILYTISMLLVFGLISMSFEFFGIFPDNYIEYVEQLRLPPYFYLSIIGFFLFSTLLINFIVLMNQKFGHGNLLLMFVGKYHKPVVEDRLFMFLDLEDSTTIAEQLGHIRYSRLLQDCFLELNRLVPEAGAEIYQYVGDEAVLTWKNGIDKSVMKPIQLFFAFKKRLERKSKLYIKKFGLVPDFKAGLHGGLVTTAEIGDIKREIAHHGDVVNTASRLRSACNDFGKSLLASGFIVDRMDKSYDYHTRELGKIHLKGKIAGVKVYSIE